MFAIKTPSATIPGTPCCSEPIGTILLGIVTICVFKYLRTLCFLRAGICEKARQMDTLTMQLVCFILNSLVCKVPMKLFLTGKQHEGIINL